MMIAFSPRLGAQVSAFAALCGLLACSSGTTTTVSPEGGTTGVVAPAESCKSAHPASQAASGPCCTEWGADACGAGLFCAAFDGRTQTTCYAERSRADGQTCTENIQCEGNACNASGICKKPTTTTPPPPPGKCTPQCDVDADCQSTCPASGSSIACCDTVTAICYQSGAGTCPVH